MFLWSHPWTGCKCDIVLGGWFDPVGFVSIIIKFFIEFILSDRIGGYAGIGNFFPGNPGNGVKDKLTVAINSPVSMVVSTGETGSASASLPGDSPEQGLSFALG